MNQKPPLRFRVAALWMLVAVPTLSGIIPILGMSPQDIRVGVEDHHRPENHGFSHNHLICIQQESNRWAPAPPLPCTAAIRLLKE